MLIIIFKYNLAATVIHLDTNQIIYQKNLFYIPMITNYASQQG